MEVTVKEAANKKSSLRFPSLPDKEIRVKGNAKYQKYDIIKQDLNEKLNSSCGLSQ